MSKSKKTEGETPDEAAIRRQLETIANTANRSEKVSFERKMNNLVALVADLNKIEEQIVELQIKKQPLIDSVFELRQAMVESCVHPYEYLVHKDDHIVCKFCNSIIGIPNG